MNKIVIYYSLEGSTEMVAKKIAEKLGADILKIDTVKKYVTKGFFKFVHAGGDVFMNIKPELEPYEFDASKYDTIIFATPVWASNFSPAFKTFIDKNKEQLQGKNFYLYTGFLGSGADSAATKMANYLGIEKFMQHLVLVDPIKKPSEKNEQKISDFCKSISE